MAARQRRTRNVAHMPIMRVQCATCPFRGVSELRRTVEARLMKVSQTCHSTGAMDGKPDTHICRGARDLQLTFLHRIGFLPEPTDECWNQKVQELGL